VSHVAIFAGEPARSGEYGATIRSQEHRQIINSDDLPRVGSIMPRKITQKSLHSPIEIARLRPVRLLPASATAPGECDCSRRVRLLPASATLLPCSNKTRTTHRTNHKQESVVCGLREF
jgi:hypothetical protein